MHYASIGNADVHMHFDIDKEDEDYHTDGKLDIKVTGYGYGDLAIVDVTVGPANLDGLTIKEAKRLRKLLKGVIDTATK